MAIAVGTEGEKRKSCRLIKNSGRTFFPMRQQGKKKKEFQKQANKVPRVSLPADHLLLPFPQHLGGWYLLLIEQKA